MSGERGAALLEILVALAITAMLAGAAAGMLGMGLTTLDRAGAAAARGADALALRRDLGALLTRLSAGPESASGGEEGFRWRGAAPDGAGGWRVGFWRLGEELALERCESLEGPCATETEPRGAARFAYAGADGEWRPDWPAGPAPALIRVTAEGGEMIFAPRVGGAAR